MKRMIALACGMLWSACTSALFYQTFEAVEPCAGLVCPEIEWVDIDFDSGLQVMKTEVTVAQYRDCVDAGVCFLPAAHEAWTSGSESCLTDATWLRTDEASRSMPINCLSRSHAERFANWVGARLPSAEEWLHAATSEGVYVNYPWGDELEEDACLRAIVHGATGTGCGRSAPHPPCARPRGNSDQGVCDLVGNLAEMLADGQFAIGGHYAVSTTYVTDSDALEVRQSFEFDEDELSYFVGLRLVRDQP